MSGTGPSRRQQQVSERIAHLAGEFLVRESNHETLITVTHATVSPDLKNATIFLSVMPQERESEALSFAKRQRSEFREYVREHAVLKFLPFFDFTIDEGEKNRQRIDDLTRR